MNKQAVRIKEIVSGNRIIQSSVQCRTEYESMTNVSGVQGYS